MPKFLIIKLFPLLLGGLLTLSGCTIHRVDVQQGNVVTPEALEKLKLGMNVQQVQSVMGSPLIVDPFRDNRWDYVYQMHLGNIGVVQASHVTLFFENNVLSKVEVQKPPIAEKDLTKPNLRKR